MQYPLRTSQKWKNFLASACFPAVKIFRPFRTFQTPTTTRFFHISSRLPSQCSKILPLTDVKTVGSTFASQNPKVHILKGFGDFRPRQKVIETIYEQINVFEKSEAEKSPSKFPSGAFYVLDLQELESKKKLWNTTFPNIMPFYAVKSNPQIEIIKFFAKQRNTGFDCASINEMKAVLQLGVDCRKIILAHPMKQMSHMRFAHEHGVLKTVFDSECEAHKLRSVTDEWELFLRFYVDDRDAQCSLGQKYGASPKECLRLFALARDLGLHIKGLTFHCGSGALPRTFPQALKTLRTLIPMARSFGHDITTIDCGGGYKHETLGAISQHISKPVNELLKQNFSLMSEPGRFFVSTTQTLVVKVIGKKIRNNRQSLFINDGIYRSFSNAIYDHSRLLDEPNGKPTTIFGNTCDGLDKVDCSIPEVQIFDWLVIPNMGAYTNGSASEFNSFPKNEFVVLDESD